MCFENSSSELLFSVRYLAKSIYILNTKCKFGCSYYIEQWSRVPTMFAWNHFRSPVYVARLSSVKIYRLVDIFLFQIIPPHHVRTVALSRGIAANMWKCNISFISVRRSEIHELTGGRRWEAESAMGNASTTRTVSKYGKPWGTRGEQWSSEQCLTKMDAASRTEKV